ncbi:type I restriction enzyme S subunit [Rhodanobacter sp. ANJX3]|uniref:restriction endonuclease subunit S n=1 Tax=Rhodanobacter sp. ANJX3 TaxID=2723083 RepID=UPI001619E641|nr:restriction endonuclease subunit S [Rhodanobacter sp. ANJX3]MBB5357188.1 type I restriction enzyme S subunit [Rhodanobacter sp. ANJX3]
MTSLPQHWVTVPIGDICDLVNGRAFKPSEWSETGHPIVRIQNLNRPTASFNHFEGPIDDRFAVDDGDLLFAWSGTPGTSFGAHLWEGGPAVLNQHIYRVDFDRELIDPVFFKFAINETLDELIGQAHGGVGLRHVTKGTFQKTRISLPPTNEQRRIAAAIAAYSDRIDVTYAGVQTALSASEEYKEAVLRKAFEENPGYKGKRPDYLPLVELVDEGPANGWSPKTGPDATGPLALRLTATTSGYLRLDEAAVKRVYERPQDDSKYWLKSGDLLVQRANALEHLGATAIFDGPEKTYIYPDLMMRLRVGDESRRRYLWRYLNSANARRYLREHATGTAGNMPKISGATLRGLPIPIPPGGNFLEAADFIDREFATIEIMRQTAADTLETLRHLQKAILSRAFRGELVQPAPSDEPADLLFERIKRTKNAQPPRRRQRIVQPKRKTHTIKRGALMSQKRRADVTSDYLKLTLVDMGGIASAKELWRRSEMIIDEFYKQLRQEIDRGDVAIGSTNDELVVRHAA